MKSLILLFCGLLLVKPAPVQRRGVSIGTFLRLKSMNLTQGENWLLHHHFILTRDDIIKGVERQTYLSDQPDALGDHDALFLVFGRVTSPPQYISYSTNQTRFEQFRRDLPAYQFQAVNAYRDAMGDEVIQYRNDGDVIELTTLCSPRVNRNLYSISFVISKTSTK